MDIEAVQKFALHVWRIKQGELVALMISAGDRLGLFAAVAESGPTTPEQLAEHTGFAERPLREWLYGMAAADLLVHDQGTFSMAPEAQAVLLDNEASPFQAIGAFATSPPELVDPIVDLIRTGRGISYEDMGEHLAIALERMTAPGHLTILPDLVLPAAGLVGPLTDGMRVADVGAGAAVAAEMLARRFPASQVIATDPSATAIRRAVDRASDLDNIEAIVGTATDTVTHGPFDLVLALDCLHDMPRPDEALHAIHEMLADGGRVLVKEIKTSGDFERDRRNPLLALNYGLSLVSCLSSGLSEPDGLGLGNMGMTPDVLEQMAAAAGFSTVTRLDVADPAASWFVLDA